MICKYFSHSFQHVSIVFVLTASLSSWNIDISKMAYFDVAHCDWVTCGVTIGQFRILTVGLDLA